MEEVKSFLNVDFFKAFIVLPRNTQQGVMTFLKKFIKNPMSPGIHYEKVRAYDSNLYSVRINDAYRGIVLRPNEGNTFSLLWVAHHDNAYEWAKRRKTRVNPVTGALEIVEIQEKLIARHGNENVLGLFAAVPEEELRRLGIKSSKITQVRNIMTFDQFVQYKSNFTDKEFDCLELLAEGFSVQAILENQAAANINQIDTKDIEKALQKDIGENRLIAPSDETAILKLIDELISRIPVEDMVKKNELDKARADMMASMTSIDGELKKEMEVVKQGISQQLVKTKKNLEKQIAELRKMIETMKENAAAVVEPGSNYLEFGKDIGIGYKIGGRYEVKELLGKGNYCSVYLAQDTRETSKKSRYAVKVMTGADEENMHIVANEVKVRAALEHPNIGRFMFADQVSSGDYLLILEYYEGESLKRRMEAIGRNYTWSELRPIVTQVLAGLSFIHQNEFVHGDICPKNILLGNDGLARLVEFGASGVIDAPVHLQRDLRVDYQPPDMFFHSPGKVAAYGKKPSQDTFSLGVIMCECLYGEHPYKNRQPSLSEFPRIPREKRISVPSPLEAIILRACNADGMERYRNAMEMKQALLIAKLIDA